MWLFLVFVTVPLIEIALFIQIGGAIGLFATLAIVVLTALLGTSLVRRQGGEALRQLQGAFNDLRDPTVPLANGAMILFAGALLLTPGFFTDAIGFALLIPAVRAAALSMLRRRITVQGFGAPHAQNRRPPEPGTIDGSYVEVPPTDTDAPGKDQPSGWTRH